jgi:hypothetical protein
MMVVLGGDKRKKQEGLTITLCHYFRGVYCHPSPVVFVIALPVIVIVVIIVVVTTLSLAEVVMVASL